MKPGDDIRTLMAEAFEGDCGHLRQKNPYSDEVLPCPHPGCLRGPDYGRAPGAHRRLVVRGPLRGVYQPSTTVEESVLEAAEAWAQDVEIVDVDPFRTRTETRTFWLWRFE